MSNFEEKFRNWQEKMSKKSEREKHNYAITVAIILTAIVTFFVVSNWYYRISGESLNSSFFTDIENIFYEQRNNFNGALESFNQQKENIIETVSGNQIMLQQGSTSSSTLESQ